MIKDWFSLAIGLMLIIMGLVYLASGILAFLNIVIGIILLVFGFIGNKWVKKKR